MIPVCIAQCALLQLAASTDRQLQLHLNLSIASEEGLRKDDVGGRSKHHCTASPACDTSELVDGKARAMLHCPAPLSLATALPYTYRVYYLAIYFNIGARGVYKDKRSDDTSLSSQSTLTRTNAPIRKL